MAANRRKGRTYAESVARRALIGCREDKREAHARERAHYKPRLFKAVVCFSLCVTSLRHYFAEIQTTISLISISMTSSVEAVGFFVVRDRVQIQGADVERAFVDVLVGNADLPLAIAYLQAGRGGTRKGRRDGRGVGGTNREAG